MELACRVPFRTFRNLLFSRVLLLLERKCGSVSLHAFFSLSRLARSAANIHALTFSHSHTHAYNKTPLTYRYFFFSINHGNDCSNGPCCSTEEYDCNRDCESENEEEAQSVEDPQILRHLVLLILLLCSMFTVSNIFA